MKATISVKEILGTAARLLGAVVIMMVAFFVSAMVSGAVAVQLSPEEAAISGQMALLVSTINALILSYLALRSRWHALDRGYEVVGVCRKRSVGKLDAFKEVISVVPGPTNDREVINRAVAGCDGVLTVLVPWGRNQYSTGTAQAVLDFASPGARPIFSCGWHITRDGLDVYPKKLKREETIARWMGSLTRLVDIDDQIEACRRVFASETLWTVVRGSDLEEGESQGLPVWSRHVGDPVLESNITRRVDFALFMVHALENDDLIHEAPAIVGCQTPSALAHAAAAAARGDR